MSVNLMKILQSVKAKMDRSKLKSYYHFKEEKKYYKEYNITLNDEQVTLIGYLFEFFRIKMNIDDISEIQLSEELEKELISWIYDSFKIDFPLEKKTQQLRDDYINPNKENIKEVIIDIGVESAIQSIDSDDTATFSIDYNDYKESVDISESQIAYEEANSEENPFDEITITENQDILSIIEVEVLLSSSQKKQDEPIHTPLTYGLNEIGINRIFKRSRVKVLIKEALTIKCSNCNSKNICKCGYNFEGKQIWNCGECNEIFTQNNFVKYFES